MSRSRYDDLNDEEIIAEAIDFIASSAPLPEVIEARLKTMGMMDLISPVRRTEQ